jgi:hypothetical protein
MGKGRKQAHTRGHTRTHPALDGGIGGGGEKKANTETIVSTPAAAFATRAASLRTDGKW